MNTRIKASWSNFTQPAQHDPKKFVYLVTGLSEEEYRLGAIQRHKFDGTYDPEQDFDLHLFPEKIHKIKRIYTSVVTAEHPFVFVRNGLILRCPPENIIDMRIKDSFGDLGIDPSAYNVSLTVDQLVKATQPGHFNEVVLAGTTQHGRVEVVGLFTAPGYRKGNSNGFTEAHAQQFRVPLVTHAWKLGKIPGLTDILSGKLPPELMHAIQSGQLSMESGKSGDTPFVSIEFKNPAPEVKKTTPPPKPSSSEKKAPADSYCGFEGGFLNPHPKPKATSSAPTPSSPAPKKQDDGWFKPGFLLKK
jgi:hypothetical protein